MSSEQDPLTFDGGEISHTSGLSLEKGAQEYCHILWLEGSSEWTLFMNTRYFNQLGLNLRTELRYHLQIRSHWFMFSFCRRASDGNLRWEAPRKHSQGWTQDWIAGSWADQDTGPGEQVGRTQSTEVKWAPMNFRGMDLVISRQWKLKAMEPPKESGLLLNSSPGQLSIPVTTPRAWLWTPHIKECVQSLPNTKCFLLKSHNFSFNPCSYLIYGAFVTLPGRSLKIFLLISQKDSLTFPQISLNLMVLQILGTFPLSSRVLISHERQPFRKDTKEINLNIHREGWCWSWSSNSLATWCEEPIHWKIG